MDNERALKYSTIAGDHALRMYANNEAADHYARAIKLAKTMDVSSEILIHLCASNVNALQEAARFEDLIEHCKEFEAIALECGDTALELAALIPRAIVYSTFTSVQDQQKGEDLTLRILELARSVSDHRAESKALWLLLLLNSYGASQFEKAIEYGLQSLAIAREHGFIEEEAFTLNDLGRAYHENGDPDRALQVTLEAQALWIQMDNKPMLIDNYVATSMTYYESGDLEKCLATIENAVEISQEIGNLWGQSGTLAVTILPLLALGKIELALDNGISSMKMISQIDMGFFELAERTILAWACGTVGLFDKGLDFLKTDKHESDEGAGFFNLINTVKAYLYLLKGDSDSAEECIKVAYGSLDTENLNPAFETYMGAFKFFPAIAIGEVLWELGLYEKLRDFTDSSGQLMESLNNRTYALEMQRLKGQAEFELGLYDDAKATLIFARDRAQEFGFKRNLWPILHYLSKVEQA
jgi:tetratricopeptide (TPR) repeat protein